jgi:enoyl-CoA hydratase
MATIEYSTEGHVATITINRPEARNAVNGDVANGMEDAIDRLEADDSLWLGVLTGVPPVFSAGADLKAINAGRGGEASTTATFGIPEVKRCLVAAAGGLFRLPRKIPFNIAMELALTGDPIDAARAYHFGLVNQLVEPGRALDAAKDLARRIEANAPVAVRESRRVILGAMTEDEETGWRLSNEGMAKAMGSADNKEGLMAFIEKRPPVWTGK